MKGKRIRFIQTSRSILSPETIRKRNRGEAKSEWFRAENLTHTEFEFDEKEKKRKWFDSDRGIIVRGRMFDNGLYK